MMKIVTLKNLFNLVDPVVKIGSLLMHRTLPMIAMIGKQFAPLSSPINRLTYLS
jgi:hypothetical protein